VTVEEDQTVAFVNQLLETSTFLKLESQRIRPKQAESSSIDERFTQGFDPTVIVPQSRPRHSYFGKASVEIVSASPAYKWA
jgi:hypothetical protein